MIEPLNRPTRLLRFVAGLARWSLGCLLALWLLLAVAWGALHGWIVPRIGEFRPQLEAQAARALGLPVHVRLPLVPGCNDSPDNIRATAAFISTLPNVQKFEILPYHRLGEPKWRQLERSYELHDVLPPSREHVYELADIARAYDIDVGIGG